MRTLPKPKKYTTSLAPRDEYRKDYKYRHISFESNSLEAVLRWLHKIEERKFDKRFPWHSGYIYKRKPGSISLENIFSFNFKY